MQNEMEEALCNLYNLEEDMQIEAEDETPFMSYVRLKEALGDLYDLEENSEEEIIEEQQNPTVRMSKYLELVETDGKGKIHRIVAMEKSVVHEEKLEKVEKNPDLRFLCSIDRIKIYYNTVSDEFWMLILKPLWIRHKKTMQVMSWVKLQEHDFQTMKVLGILHNRNFSNPLPQTIYVKKKDRKKAKQITEKFNRENLSKTYRKNHCSGKLKLISIEGRA